MNRLTAALRRFFWFFVPKSLIGQLVFTFSFGFLSILLISTFFADHTRQYFFLRNFAADCARRMTDSVLLLEMVPEPSRAELPQRLRYRGLRGILLPAKPELPPLLRSSRPMPANCCGPISICNLRKAVIRPFLSSVVRRGGNHAGRPCPGHHTCAAYAHGSGKHENLHLSYSGY